MKTSQLGFLTFGLTYLGFVGLEYVRPGFVAHVLSVHWLLLVTTICGAWWYRGSGRRSSGWIEVGLMMIIGSGFATMVWIEGSIFGDARLFLTLAALTLPALAFLALRDAS